ncbi:MAG: S-layer homology domain-containing protein [Clostridia bacterium]|nr:S-layer homology domain-containing protein [Clostridia bacterium]
MKKFIIGIICFAFLLPCFVITVNAETSTRFTDVNDEDWYYYASMILSGRKIMIGTSANTFSPDSPLSREQAAVVLFTINKRLGKIPDIDVPTHYETMSFKDVEPGKWYSDYVEFAYRQGWLAGIGNGYFGLGKYLSRQDAMVLLNHYYINMNDPESDSIGTDYADSNPRYGEWDRIRKQYPIPTDFAQIEKYNDKDEISEYALESVIRLLTPFMRGNENQQDLIDIVYPCHFDLVTGYIHPKQAINRAEFGYMVWNVILHGNLFVA